MTETATLTDEGRQALGHIFPDGKVPLRHILGEQVTFPDSERVVYMADWNQLSDAQKDQLREFMRTQRGIPDDVFSDLLKQTFNCVPLREELVNVVTTDEIHKYGTGLCPECKCDSCLCGYMDSMAEMDDDDALDDSDEGEWGDEE